MKKVAQHAQELNIRAFNTKASCEASPEPPSPRHRFGRQQVPVKLWRSPASRYGRLPGSMHEGSSSASSKVCRSSSQSQRNPLAPLIAGTAPARGIPRQTADEPIQRAIACKTIWQPLAQLLSHLGPHQVQKEHQIQQSLHQRGAHMLRPKDPQVVARQQKHRRKRSGPSPPQ